MDRFLGNYSTYSYAILRIVAGLTFALHGSQKLFGFSGDKPPMQIVSLMGISQVIELVCGLLVALGLLIGYATFIGSGKMAVAYFIVHFPSRAQNQFRNTLLELSFFPCFGRSE